MSRRRGGFVNVDLAADAWRLGLAAVPTTAGAGIGLVWIWPSRTPGALVASPGQTIIPTDGMHQWALAVAEVSLAKSPDDLRQAALVALENGSEENDIKRVSEAMSMFRNLPRYREETLRSDIDSVVGLVKAFWQITAWAMEPAPARFDLTVGDAVLVGVP